MLSLLAAFVSSQVTYKLSGLKFTVETTDPNDVIDSNYILLNFPERNWTSLKVTGPIKNISYSAFSGATNCEHIDLPDTIEVIQAFAFAQNDGLVDITLPKSTTTIGRGAFKNCLLLRSVHYHKTTVMFFSEAFAQCPELESFTKCINDDTQQPANARVLMPHRCFYDCPNLKNVELPDNLRFLGYNCFGGDQSLESITLPSTVTVIGSSCFLGATTLKHINLEKIKIIGKDAFSGCMALEKLTTGEDLNFINQSAFQSCLMLSDVSSLAKAKNLTFRKYCFEGCASLKSITIPDTMDEIPDGAFSQCRSLDTIVFKGEIFRIGKYAFYNTSFTHFTIPKSVSKIEDGAFVSMRKLTTISIDSSNNFYGVDSNNFLYNKQENEIIIYPQGNPSKIIDIPATYKKIGYGAFSYCKEINTINFKGEMTDIGCQAFAHCQNLLGTVTLPKGLTCVNDETFVGCSKLIKVIIPEGTKSLALRCFANCRSLVEIQIPSSIQNIAKECFKSCYALYSVDIHNARINEEYIFSGCSALKTVVLGSEITEIGIGVFSYCTSLKTITLGAKITKISAYAFNKAGLTSIKIPDNCSRIDDHAFNGTSIETITFPVVFTEIPMNLLAYTLSLKKVEFLGEIDQIGQDVFYGSAVKQIVFKKNINNIGNTAFARTNLESITYCGTAKVTGSALKDVTPVPKIYTTADYTHDTFASAKIEAKAKTYCPDVAPLPKPTEVSFSNLGNKTKYIIIGAVVGLVILVAVIVAVIVPCIMKRNGWSKKETLTESLLTQTV